MCRFSLSDSFRICVVNPRPPVPLCFIFGGGERESDAQKSAFVSTRASLFREQPAVTVQTAASKTRKFFPSSLKVFPSGKFEPIHTECRKRNGSVYYDDQRRTGSSLEGIGKKKFTLSFV